MVAEQTRCILCWEGHKGCIVQVKGNGEWQMGKTVGVIIWELREEQNIARGKLCRGLCTSQMLSLIEQDKCETDQYTLDILLQRLGKSPDKLELILPSEEYQRMRSRDIIEELCWKRKKERALYLLDRYMQRFPKKTSVQKMYEFRVRAYISRRLDGDAAAAESFLRRAIDATLPGVTAQNLMQYMISGIELENLLALGLCMIDRDRLQEAEGLLENCRRYIEAKITDEEERALIYAKYAWLRSQIDVKKGQFAAAYARCKDAMYGLRKFGILYFMMPLLEQLISCGDQIGVEEGKNKWKKYYGFLGGLYEKYGQKWYCHDSLFHNPHNTAFHLDSEFIRQERLAQNLTQEKLIEGVYQSPESLSRVENGKASPTKRKPEGLLQNLGIERGRLCGTIAVEDFKTLELKMEIDILIGQGRYEEAEAQLEILEKELDDSWRVNAAVLENYCVTINYYLGRITPEEALEREKELLKQGYWVEKETYGKVPLENELMVLNQTALLLRKLNRQEEANEIYLQIIETVHRSKMKAIYRSRIVSLPYANLAINTKEYEYCKRGLQYELSCDKGTHLPYYLHILALNDNVREQKELILQVYYLCELFFRQGYKKLIKNYYEENWGENLC